MPLGSRTATVTLPGEDRILITRDFGAPPGVVFRAWTEPELIRRWWAGRRGKMVVVEVDLRLGGRWRYVMVADGGHEVGFHGEYREVVPGERLVHTEVYEGVPGGDDAPALTTVTFVPGADGGTRVELLMQLPDRATRDMVVESGMELGMQEQMTLLDELTAALPDET